MFYQETSKNLEYLNINIDKSFVGAYHEGETGASWHPTRFWLYVIVGNFMVMT